MFSKILSLQTIHESGMNHHNYYIPNTYSEFLDIVNQVQHCTIRTDHANITKDLPFYVYHSDKDNESKLIDIWEIANKSYYKLIISDGIKYDNIQKYNMSVSIKQNGDFIFETSELKIPLRHMYKHPLLSCEGNIGDEVSSWLVHNARYGINRHEVKRDLESLYDHKLFDRWLEITKYPIPVGVKQEKIVFWQI